MAKAQPRRATTDLPEFEPLVCRIDTSNAVHDDRFDEDRVKLTMTVVQGEWAHKDPPAKISAAHTLTVESRGDGTPSIYAQVVHAVHPADLTKQELYDYDSDGLKGHLVAVVGQVRETEKGRFWNPIAYRRPAPAPAAQAADDSYQYTDGRTHRWRPGMTEWEPVPATTSPPPPPPAPAAVPPPAPAAAPPPLPAVRF